jgi:hypothetical protein
VTARPIVIKNVDDPNADARHVFFQDLQSLGVAIACDDGSPVFHQLCDVTGFSARSRARVEHALPWLQIERPCRALCPEVLNRHEARIEARQALDRHGSL